MAEDVSSDSPTSESPASTPSPSLESPPPLTHSYSAFDVPTSPSTSHMSATSTPLGNVTAARRPVVTQQPTMSSRGGLPQELQDRMKAFRLGRQGSPQVQTPGSAPASQERQAVVGGLPASLGFAGAPRPSPHSTNSASSIPDGSPKLSLAAKRGLATPSASLPGTPPPTANKTGPGRKRPGLTLSQMDAGNTPNSSTGTGANASAPPAHTGSMLDKYSQYIDKQTGALQFKGKAVLTSQGVEFAGGQTFNISLDEVDTLDELGKGNYGTVFKVRHSRPRIRRPGQGLAGNKSSHIHQPSSRQTSDEFQSLSGDALDATANAPCSGSGTGIVMAMKETRLELEDAKFATIIMELDVLHRCISPYIVDFYGAFFQEGAVYICMEFMDGGSIDKLYGEGVPEEVLRKVTLSTVMGLKSLKDEHNIIHRDVKPTNILVNTKGQVKICDFGVSGNLVASIAKTNIGCQSYMAPERISSGGMAQIGAGAGTYSVQSDIWSLGLSIIECAMGHYPYPPETYDNIFSQLSAIVDGDPPDLPEDRYSEAARQFVRSCLMKTPMQRPTYAALLQHAWLAPLLKPATITEEDEEAAEKGQNVTTETAPLPTTADNEVAEWVKQALDRKKKGLLKKKAPAPALHAAPLDAMASPVATA